MHHTGPHISIPSNYVVNRILKINIDDFSKWPESVKNLAIAIAEELFLVAYNPFIDSNVVKESVQKRFEQESVSLAHYYATAISEGITMFWSAYEAENEFKQKLIEELKKIMPDECIRAYPMALIETATDATDLRMELPLLVAEPENSGQIAAIARLANEMKFAIIPRGGGSGMTGGAVPARKRALVLSLNRLTKISAIDLENMSVVCEAGAITQQVFNAVDKVGALFSVDPASKQASSIGGNIAENAGGPMAFEYGTTLDNLLWWKMVTPTGETILIERENHPRHKILPDETAVFVVKDISGGVRNVIHLRGDEIRLPGLGKDVTNKVLGGLPGMQKEGVDGIIVEACFAIHKKPLHSRVMCLEFYGRSMHPAAIVVRELVKLRNKIREEGDYAHLSALEEFNAKYVKAIDYQPKTDKFSGLPISVIILQVDGDDAFLLDKCVKDIVEVVKKQENVDIFVAHGKKEAELFWEDRHKLAAIAKRTSGFKLNEDVVIPMEKIPDFALFLEKINLESAARSYRHALQEISRLPGFPMNDKGFNREFALASSIAAGEMGTDEISDDELVEKAQQFLNLLKQQFPRLAENIAEIQNYMESGRIIVASHMHAGDGNCHVNIPVNSNDSRMLSEAEQTAAAVMTECQEMGGEVSGEHGIGITKIAFFSREKMESLEEFKKRVDPRDVMNPAKLIYRELPVKPFTFSFNRLINDIRESGLPDKEILIDFLTTIQVCTRCGKCRLVCPMCYPERSIQYHPRNKNMALGMLIEAIYYSQSNTGRIDENLLDELREIVEHCTGCGRCMANCPVKIPSNEVALSLRAFLDHEGKSGHPVKDRALNWLVQDVQNRVPKAAKMASLGQKFQNRILDFVPGNIQQHLANPLFSGKGPKIGYTNLYESLKLNKGSIFCPREFEQGMKLVIYFPGCGGSLFYDRIGLSSIMLLLKAGYAVYVPPVHMCCGFPLLSSGHDAGFNDNAQKNREFLKNAIQDLKGKGFDCMHLVTSCGSCREALEHLEIIRDFPEITQMDITQLVLKNIDYKNVKTDEISENNVPDENDNTKGLNQDFIYHASCHSEWANSHKIKSQKMLAQELSSVTGQNIKMNEGCCGESGMGAMTSPDIYNPLRERKKLSLNKEIANGNQNPILVGCPSCKIGIGRTLLNLHDKRPVLHIAEWLASLLDGEDRRQSFRRKANETKGEIRVINMDQ